MEDERGQVEQHSEELMETPEQLTEALCCAGEDAQDAAEPEAPAEDAATVAAAETATEAATETSTEAATDMSAEISTETALVPVEDAAIAAPATESPRPSALPSFEEAMSTWDIPRHEEPTAAQEKKRRRREKKRQRHLSRVAFRRRCRAHKVSLFMTVALTLSLLCVVIFLARERIDPSSAVAAPQPTPATLGAEPVVLDVVMVDGEPVVVALREGVQEIIDYEAEYGQFLMVDENGVYADADVDMSIPEAEDDALPMEEEDIEEIAEVVIADEEGHAAISVDGGIVCTVDSTEDAKWLKDKLFEAYAAPQEAKELRSIGFKEVFEVMTIDEDVRVTAREEAYLALCEQLHVLTTEEVIKEEALKYETKYIDDATLAKGTSKTVQEGKNGSRTATYVVTYENGKEKSRKLQSQKVHEAAVSKIVNRGTKATSSSSGSSSGSSSSTYTSGKSGPNEGSKGKDQGSLSFDWPVKGKVSSNFGPRWGRYHYGIDIPGKTGTPLLASEGGVVTSYYGNRGDYGLLVEIDHGNGFKTRYAHCSQLLVNVGDTVSKGQTVALMGSTGNSTGPHIHFEIRVDGSAYNPRYYLNDGFKY